MGLSQPATDGQPAVDGSSGDQVIIISCSLESEPTVRTEPGRVAQSESSKDDLAPSVLQVIPPSDRAEGQPSRTKFMRYGLPRPY